MPEEFVGPSVDWFALSPLLTLLGGGLFLLVVGALTPRWPRGWYAFVAATTAGAAGVLAIFQWYDIIDSQPGTLVAGALAFDTFAQFMTITICGAVVLVALLCDDDVRGTDREGPEVFALLLMAAIGGVVMASANDLIVMFLGLEILSLSFYVLVASDRRRSESQEGGMKYFVLGGFSSAFFLYGIALLYGGTGSTNISEIVAGFQAGVTTGREDALILAGIALLLVGLGFKVAAVPFHVWVPDVYQGAPTPITAFMASAGKASAFAALLRVLVIALPFHRDDWRPVIWVLAVLSLVIAPMLAIVQTNVKRMLAFGSISHAGFILVAFEAAGHRAGEADPGTGMQSVVVYLAIYSVLTIGTMAVISTVSRAQGGDTRLTILAGLASRRPVMALSLTLLLIAQAGVPLTSGFVAKFGAIQAAVTEGSYVLAIIAMSAAVIAAFVYLRIMVTMWMSTAPGADRQMLAYMSLGRPADETEAEAAPDGGAIATSGATSTSTTSTSTSTATSTSAVADADLTGADIPPEPIPLSTAVAITFVVGFTLVVGFFPSWLLDAAANITNYAR
jgi:NADH-quinone oxidoreductase subunit N